MTGIKTNERPGTRAQVKYVRVSAYKAREVLDQIRGLHVGDAADVLALSERAVSNVIAKCLDSAVANAENNDLQDAEELFVSACYADEGPTMKRWRPRARGRATRIRKRTCHITIIVGRMDDDALEMRRAKLERRLAGGGRDARADRAARVAKSRGEEVAEADEAEDIVDELEDETVGAEDATDAEADAEAQAETDVESGDDAEGEETDEPASATTDGLDEASGAEDTADASGAEGATDFGPDSHAPLADGSMPDGFPIKGNADSMKYHQPGGRWYDNTVAEVWFTSAEAAEEAGFTEAGKKASKDAGDDEAASAGDTGLDESSGAEGKAE